MPRTRPKLVVSALATAVAAGALGACGSQEIRADQANTKGAVLFHERCSGCHTLNAAAAEGSAYKINDRERVDGPNFNVRKETADQVLYAIRNGGFSGAIMPENILVGQDAQAVARFLGKYSGGQGAKPPSPDG